MRLKSLMAEFYAHATSKKAEFELRGIATGEPRGKAAEVAERQLKAAGIETDVARCEWLLKAYESYMERKRFSPRVEWIVEEAVKLHQATKPKTYGLPAPKLAVVKPMVKVERTAEEKKRMAAKFATLDLEAVI